MVSKTRGWGFKSLSACLAAVVEWQTHMVEGHVLHAGRVRSSRTCGTGRRRRGCSGTRRDMGKPVVSPSARVRPCRWDEQALDTHSR